MSINQDDIIAVIKSGKNTFWQIIKTLDANEKEIIELLNEMKKQDLLEFGETIKLKKDFPKTSGFIDNQCKTCNGKTVSLSPEYKKIFEKFNELTGKIVLQSDDFLQGRIDPMDSISKIALMNQNRDVSKKDILIIGDDDFISIALALTEQPKRIQVLEIDRWLVETILSISEKNNLNIQAEVYNVEDKLPEKFENCFDVFVTEPPHTIPSINTFLSRGIQALRNNGTAYFVQTHLASPIKKWHAMQENILKMGLAITHIIPQFCTYPDTENEFEEYTKKTKLYKAVDFELFAPKETWYTTALFRAELVNEGNPLVRESVKVGKALYEDEDTLLT